MNPETPPVPNPSFEYGMRSVRDVVVEWHPAYDDKWRNWIRESHARYISNDEAVHFRGLNDFAIVLGDSGAPELCALVALYGQQLAKTEQDLNYIRSHIRIITVGLGIELHKDNPSQGYGVPPVDYGNCEKWLLDRPAWVRWREHKLQDFGGDRQSAAEASIRLACIHAGVIAGDVALTFESLCNPSLWHLTPA